jgi:hypothetical protein
MTSGHGHEIFESMQVVSLLKLYAEVERTGRAHQFEEKLPMRSSFAQVVGEVQTSPLLLSALGPSTPTS